MRAAIESASAQEIRRHIDRIAKRDFMRSMIEIFLAEELASLPQCPFGSTALLALKFLAPRGVKTSQD